MDTLKGKVLDIVTHQPINEASVILQKTGSDSNEIAQITNDDGMFQYNSLSEGDYKIKVFSDGYTGKTVSYNCCDETQSTITIYLDKP